MGAKTKTIIEETEADIDPKSLALLVYRVQKLEETSKEAAVSQREGVDMLSGKIDALAHNFVTQAELAAAQRESALQHAAIKDEIKTLSTSCLSRLNKLESWNTWLVRIIVGAVATAVIGLVIVSKTGAM